MKKCPEHGYTLKERCGKCAKETKEAHYKYLKFSRKEREKNIT